MRDGQPARTKITAFCGLLLACASVPITAGGDDAIETLSQSRTIQQVQDSIEELRAHLRGGGRIDWQRLIAFTTDHSLGAEQRARTLMFILNEGGDDALNLLVERCVVALETHGPEWVRLVEGRKAGVENEKERERLGAIALPVLLVANWLKDNEAWSRVEDREALAEFCTGIVRYQLIPRETVHEFSAEVPDLPLPAEARSRIALEFALAHGGIRASNDSLLEPQIAVLREMVRDAEPGESDYPHGAAAALADIGDRATLPILREHAEQLRRLERETPEDQVAFAFRKSAEKIELFIGFIEAQQSDQAILDTIARPIEHDGTVPVPKVWAVERALQMGVSKEAIRESILRFAATEHPRIEDRRRTKGKRAGEMYATGILGYLRYRGIQLGVLEEDDMGYVPIDTYEHLAETISH